MTHTKEQMLGSRLWLISALLIASCATKPPLHDSNVPVIPVCSCAGNHDVLAGYEGYTNGFVANTLKGCEALLDKAGQK